MERFHYCSVDEYLSAIADQLEILGGFSPKGAKDLAAESHSVVRFAYENRMPAAMMAAEILRLDRQQDTRCTKVHFSPI